MERHVVEHHVCERLIDIVASPLWPPSLRDTAGGCLEFFMERWVPRWSLLVGFAVVFKQREED